MDYLPKTKFLPPVLRQNIIARSELCAWVEQQIPTNRLVLLSAPAGYGKTTLLSKIPDLLPGYRLAWFSLDGEDDDPARFILGLGEALSMVHPSIKKDIETYLATTTGLVSGGNTAIPIQPAISVLINALLSLPSPPGILVLEDLHEIHSTLVLEAIVYLIDNLPACLHVAISTRYEAPFNLKRWKARRQMAEINFTDLRFSQEECKEFLNQSYQLDLSSPDVAQIQKITEGWPAGLVLLTGRLHNLAGRKLNDAFLQNIEPFDSEAFDFLADEVLVQLPEYLRKFMLDTCVLSELAPSSCNMVASRRDAGIILEEIYRNNLFLVLVRPARQNQEPVFRYHSLFAEFLKRQCQKENERHFKDLYARAARVETDPGRIIHCLVNAGLWQEAAGQIETSGEASLQNGLQKSVSDWISSLPPEISFNRPRLMYIRGLCDLLKGDMQEARLSFQSSLEMLSQYEDEKTLAQSMVGLASVAFISADFSECADLISRTDPVIHCLPEEIDFLLLRSSLALFCRCDYQNAREDLLRALQKASASSDARDWFRFSVVLAPEFSVIPRVMDEIEHFCRQMQRHIEGRTIPLRLGIEDTLAGVHLRRGRLEKSIETSLDALSVKEQLGGYPFLGLNAALTASAAYIGLGDYPQSEEYLQSAIRQIRQADLNQALTGGALFPLGRLRWLQKRYDETRQIYRQMDALPVRLPLVDVLKPVLAGLLDISARRYRQAEEHLLDAARRQSTEWVSGMYGSARLTLAFLYHEWEKPRESLACLDEILAFCEQNDCFGIIYQEMPLARRVLETASQKGLRTRLVNEILEQAGQFGGKDLIANPLLTDRQMEILRLMAAGKSNQAIADELTLSLATVKSHVVHIMDRLGATSRMEVVAIARERGWLD